MNMYEYIGIVTGWQKEQVYIRPLYKIQAGKGIQALKSSELAKLFLNGLICWDYALPVYLDSLWLFSVSGGEKSKYITSIKPLIEAIDLSNVTGEENHHAKQTQLKRQELAQIEQRIAEAKAVKKQELTAWELAALEEEITEKEQVIRQKFSAFEQEFEQKKDELSKKLVALDRQFEVQKSEYQHQLNKMNQSLEQEKKVSQQALQQLPEKSIPQIKAIQHVMKVISGLSESSMVLQRLEEVCEQRGIPFSVALSVHSTLLAGGVPVLAGESAFDILETYASCVTDGRVLRLPIAPTMLEPADLIGKPDPATRKFLPHAAGLADLWLEAKRQRDDLYLVVLDGMNRAAIECYLQSLLTLYYERLRGEFIRSFHLFHPSAVLESDPYAGLAQMYWTPNILIAATLSDGMAVIPPPASFWNNAALIDLRIAGSGLGEKYQMGELLSEYSAVSASNWLMMRERLKKRAMMISLEDTDVPIVVGNDEDSRFQTLFYQALHGYLEDKKEAADTVTVQVTMPRALATDTEGTLIRTLMNERQGMKHMIKRIEQFVR